MSFVQIVSGVKFEMLMGFAQRVFDLENLGLVGEVVGQ